MQQEPLVLLVEDDQQARDGYAEFLERDLPGYRLVPALNDSLEVPRKIPGMSRVRAVAECRHPVIGGDRITVVPHQRRIELECPDRAIVIASPF